MRHHARRAFSVGLIIVVVMSSHSSPKHHPAEPPVGSNKKRNYEGSSVFCFVTRGGGLSHKGKRDVSDRGAAFYGDLKDRAIAHLDPIPRRDAGAVHHRCRPRVGGAVGQAEATGRIGDDGKALGEKPGKLQPVGEVAVLLPKIFKGDLHLTLAACADLGGLQRAGKRYFGAFAAIAD